jgi:anti-anti-sigma regulatory factor
LTDTVLESNSLLKIAGEQTIATTGELHKMLTEHLDRGLAVALDLSEIRVCDTAALQLIFALCRSAVVRKQRFGITAVSPAIAETVAALGLALAVSQPAEFVN